MQFKGFGCVLQIRSHIKGWWYMGRFWLHIEGWLNMRSSFPPPRFWSGLAGSGGGTACVSGGTHVAVMR